MPDAVVDTTVLIALGHLDRLDLLPRLYDRVWVPNAVRREAMRDPQFYEVPRIQRAIDAALLRVMAQDAVGTDSRLSDLGAGEAAVIASASELGAVAVLDDWQGRRAARSLGLRVIGTVGLLIAGGRSGLITAALPLVQELRSAGFRIGTHELDAARAADESP
ncbi:MAG: DUF3368 domain-containing protein [Dehalococcoidia bacterium]|nr:DUF3368 domain-containing protein [Dehalococcoidia bacterium]